MHTVIELGGGSQIVVKAAADDTDGAYTLLEYTCAPGAGSRPHIHTREDEGLYVLAGALTVQTEHATWRVAAGETVHFTRGQRHAFINAEVTPALVLIIATPAGLEAYFQALGELLQSDPPATEADFSALNERFGLEFED